MNNFFIPQILHANVETPLLPLRLTILSFAAGIAWLQLQPDLPTTTVLMTCALVGTLLFAASRRYRLIAPVAACLLGIAWAGILAQHRLTDHLPTTSEGQDITVIGVVAGMAQNHDRGMRVDFDVESATLPVPRHISLAWYRMGQKLLPGERWQFVVRLKRPHGNLNPHGFDYEAWMFEHNIRASGYVRPKEEARRLDAFVMHPRYAIERLRESIRARFYHVLPAESSPYVGILIALAIGDQNAIDPALWQVFSRTGTTHLMSISGLHITMIAALFAWLTSRLWRRSSRLMLKLPAQKAAALAGFISALAYCLLSGFAVPSQRTLLMLGVVAATLLTGRNMAPSRTLALALGCVLLWDPWAVLSAGFWLSFCAVGFLFYTGIGQVGRLHPLHLWGRAQWAMTLGLLPILLALFQQFSILSPLANAVAIPVVSFMVTPLALLGTLPLSDAALMFAHGIIKFLMKLLEGLSASPWAVWQQHAPPFWTLILALIGGMGLLLPRGVPFRWVGVGAFLPMLLLPPLRPVEGEAMVTILDVGQGLAVHVQTARHDLLYDTGPTFSAEANSGNRIIVPYLRATGVRRLDGMVVTHADNDHSGGAVSVLENVPTDWLMTSLPEDHTLLTGASSASSHRPCAEGDAWEWEGVRFELLHPSREEVRTKKTNNMSCVLKVSTRQKSILLTSDIEAVAERAILARHKDQLRADILLVPHHGSRTSSTPEFIEAVNAQNVIFPVGYRNRYGHPKEDVVTRYEGVRQWRTDADGALVIALNTASIVSTRTMRRRYWH
ncbi:MAG: DNA internalization-related competence protein ComEC/Rec2 [Rhodocyclaceae bacterium]|nr:DNA internalization-related competence protein ComEC/Rec2 [Rhodocyclaceae bacterium]